MKHRRCGVLGVLSLAVALGALAPPDAHALGLGDLKKKAKEAADKAKVPDPPPAPPAPETPPAPAGGDKKDEGAGSAAGGGETVAQVSTKFDFVPGGRVLVMDDFTRDELGEFPARWKPLNGNFDVSEFKGERWLRLNGDDGVASLISDPLPEKWTLEFDIYQTAMTGPAFTLIGLFENTPSSSYGWTCGIGQIGGGSVDFHGPDGTSSIAPCPGGLNGRRHISVMANGTGIKVYVGRERLVNMPSMTYQNNQRANALGIRFWRHGGGDPLITNVRYAEGGKEKLDLLATPFVTQGIVFDSGSDHLRPESAPVLRQVAAYLKENAAVKVRITGHTDDVGEAAANQDLSNRRARAVAACLAADYGIDAARLSPDGKGEAAPLVKNDSPEGRAMNRRVEFSKA